MQYKKRGVSSGLVVYKEDGSSFSFPIMFVKLYKINKDIFTSDEIVDDYISKYAYYYSVNILGRREHSIFELRNKLKIKKIPNNIIDVTIKKLLNLNYLSNDRFIDSFIRSKKNKSKKELIMLLRAKGISSELAKSKVESIDESQRLDTLVDKLINRNKTEEQILRYLSNKGFNFYQIKQAMKKFKF